MVDIEEISKILLEEGPEAIRGFDWIKIKFFGRYSTGGYGLGLTFIDASGSVKEPFYRDAEGLTRVQKIRSHNAIEFKLYEYFLECQQADKPWNEVTFIIDREGGIEHSFVMNYQRIFQQKIDSIHTAVSGLAERVYEHLSNVLPDDTEWEAGSATLTVRENKVTASYSITIGGVPETQPLKLDGWERKMWLQYHAWVDSGELKEYFPSWNVIQIQLPYNESTFDPQQDVTYVLN